MGEVRPDVQPRWVPTSREVIGSKPDRFFFMHLQKTAGTALWRRLKNEFDESEVYPGPDDGVPPDTVLSVEHLLRRWHDRGREVRIITGHFPLCTTDLLGGRFTTLTLLRDPIERTLSALRDQHERSPELAGLPLEAIRADRARRPLLRDHMVRMLSLTPEEMSNGALTPLEMTPHHLERACARLESIDVFGFQERLDEFCDRLTRQFGWDLGPPIFMNRTIPAAASESLRASVTADNALDIQLYDFAVRLDRGTD